MLVDPLNFDSNNRAVGIISVDHFNLDRYLPGGASYDGQNAAWRLYPNIGAEQLFGCYGVCDSPEQFMDHAIGQWLAASERKFTVSFTCVRKSEQPEIGGWRWHKWGEYIGKKKPRYEYLYDEGPEITEVYVYHVYECLDEKQVWLGDQRLGLTMGEVIEP